MGIERSIYSSRHIITKLLSIDQVEVTIIRNKDYESISQTLERTAMHLLNVAIFGW